MSKNRTMQAKNAKAVKYAIAETKFRQVCEMQYERILVNSGYQSAYDKFMNKCREQAITLADKVVTVKYPDYMPEKVCLIQNNKRVPVKFNEQCLFWDKVYSSALDMLSAGMTYNTVEMLSMMEAS